MDHLSSCYFCGIALDRPLQTYLVSGPTSDDSDDVAVTLCPTCHQKLDMILDATATAATAPVSGDEPGTETIDGSDPDTVLVDLDADDSDTADEPDTGEKADAEEEPDPGAGPDTDEQADVGEDSQAGKESQVGFESRFSEPLETKIGRPDGTVEESDTGVDAAESESDADDDTGAVEFNVGKKIGTETAEFDIDEEGDVGTAESEADGDDSATGGGGDTETAMAGSESTDAVEGAHETERVDQRPERKAPQSGSSAGDDTPSSSETSSDASSRDDASSDGTQSSGDASSDAGTTSDDTQSSDDASPDEGASRANITALEYNKVMRLLQNREFPVDRNEIEHIASSAYDLPEADCAAVIDLAIDRGLLEEDSGKLSRPE